MSKLPDFTETCFPKHSEKGGPGAPETGPRFVLYAYVFRDTATAQFAICALYRKNSCYIGTIFRGCFFTEQRNRGRFDFPVAGAPARALLARPAEIRRFRCLGLGSV